MELKHTPDYINTTVKILEREVAQLQANDKELCMSHVAPIEESLVVAAKNSGSGGSNGNSDGGDKPKPIDMIIVLQLNLFNY